MVDEVDESEASKSPQPENKPAGTANLLHQLTEYNALEHEYDGDVAAGLLQKALERKGVEQTTQDVKAWAGISNAIVRDGVDVVQEAADAKAKADALANSIISGGSRPPQESGAQASFSQGESTDGDESEDDYFDEEEFEMAAEDDEAFDSEEDERHR